MSSSNLDRIQLASRFRQFASELRVDDLSALHTGIGLGQVGPKRPTSRQVTSRGAQPASVPMSSQRKTQQPQPAQRPQRRARPRRQPGAFWRVFWIDLFVAFVFTVVFAGMGYLFGMTVLGKDVVSAAVTTLLPWAAAIFAVIHLTVFVTYQGFFRLFLGYTLGSRLASRPTIPQSSRAL